MITDPSCCISKEIASSEQDKLFQEYSGIKNRKLLENELFVLLPSISPIGKGHYLVFSKTHVSAFSQLNNNISKLTSFIELACGFMRERYGELIIFEHGVAKGEPGGCGISHAHIHLLPSTITETIHVQETLNSLVSNKVNASLSELGKICGRGTYLFAGSSADNLAFYLSNHFASQTIRKIICKYRNIDNWDWKKLSDWDVYRKNHANGKMVFTAGMGA